MGNKWNIPAELERQIRARDEVCVYCGREFLSHLESAKGLSDFVFGPVRPVT